VIFLLGAFSTPLLILLCLVLRGAQVRPAAKWEAWMTGVTKRHVLVRGKSLLSPLTATAQNIGILNEDEIWSLVLYSASAAQGKLGGAVRVDRLMLSGSSDGS